MLVAVKLLLLLLRPQDPTEGIIYLQFQKNLSSSLATWNALELQYGKRIL